MYLYIFKNQQNTQKCFPDQFFKSLYLVNLIPLVSNFSPGSRKTYSYCLKDILHVLRTIKQT